MIGAFLTEVAAAVTVDAMKGSARSVIGVAPDEVERAVTAAYERAHQRFFDRYGDRFGTASESFLARQENVELALRATFRSAADLKREDLNAEGYGESPPATPEAVGFFVGALAEESAKERALDAIFADKADRELLAGVDRRMRDVHAALLEQASGMAAGGAYDGVRTPEEHVEESLRSTILPLSHVPLAVYGAPCGQSESNVRALIDYSKAGRAMLPYIVRGNMLYTFYNLRRSGGPFAAAVEGAADKFKAKDWWADPVTHRWYVELMGRALNKLTGRKRLNLDKRHKRYYFEPLRDDESDPEIGPEDAGDESRFRTVGYRTLGGTVSSRKVAYRPRFKHNGEYKNFWEHWAVSLRFHQVGPRSWCLTLRPGRRYTDDGYEQVSPKRMGRRSTKHRSRMYNMDVLNEVHFWREFLSEGSPRIVMSFGGQAIVIENEMLSGDIEWPGVPDDAKPISNDRHDEDLFSLAELDEAVAQGGEPEGDEDWDEWDEEDWDDEAE
jgi:hypothetical protein